MANDWEEMRLDEVTELIIDCPHSTPKWMDEGVVVLRSNNIKNGRLDLSSPSFTNEEGYQARVKRAIPESGDLVLTREAPMGEVCQIPGGLRCCLGQRMVLLRVKKEIMDSTFLLFALQSPYLQHQISWNEGTGTTVSNIRMPNIKAFQIPTPPLTEQKAIAHILGSLDDKMELNRQMNETLEAMAQALFKSWFVEFDPVLDNALAAGNAIPDEFMERAEQRKKIEKKDNSDIQSLFPDAFEFTEEMGWIPKGWVIDDISSLCEKIQSGGTPRRNVPEYWEDGTIPWLTSGEVRQTIIITVDNKISESGLANSSAKWLVSGTTVVAMYGATAGQVAYIDKPLTTNQAVCGLIPKKGYQFFNYVTLSRAVAHFEGRATGSAQQNINKGMIETTRVVVPSSISSDSFEEYCEVIFSKWIKNLHENETLAKLRDTLLPKLMSGELRISDTEVLVDEVL